MSNIRTPSAFQVSSDAFHWDDVKAFTAVCGSGSFRKAAGELGIALNTVRARIERLERAVGAPLFRRTPAGVEATLAGDRMRTTAEAMRRAASGARPSDVALTHPAQLTIAASEALGCLWLAPQMRALGTALPGLTLALTCDHDLARDRSGDADIGIAFTMPSDPDLIVARLGTLHYLAYASEAYLARRGTPRTIEELRGHDYIEQETPGANAALRDHLIGTIGGESAVTLRTNASLPLLFAVARGDGVSVLPSYVSLATGRIVALPVPLRLRFEVYYWFHRHAGRNPAVRAGIDWLKSAFDNRRYPCFADTFHDPREGAFDGMEEAPIAEVFRTLAG